MTPGSLAAELFACRVAQRAAEARVDQFLAWLFPGGVRGVEYTHDEQDLRIDVYGVTDSDLAAGALHLAGFATVILHQHPVERILTCSCQPHEAP